MLPKRQSKIKQPDRSNSSHKGENGKVLIIGGSKEFTGPVVLSGLAALRTGCDLVTVAAPEKVAWAINSITPDLITIKLKGDYLNSSSSNNAIQQRKWKQLAKPFKNLGGVLVGPGMTPIKEFANNIAKTIKAPFVFDADAVKTVDVTYLKNSIITPHATEFEIFLKNNLKKKDADELILQLKNKRLGLNRKAQLILNSLSKFFNDGNVLLLKGSTDIVISKQKVFFNKTGNAGMTVGGTGDVLAGLCVGYLAQVKDPFRAAALAAYNCGKMGDLLLKKYDFGYVASDFINMITKLKRLKKIR